MRYLTSALGIALLGLVSLTAPAFADWTDPQQASTGNLSHPSMVSDANSVEHIVARGDTGLWYITDESGTWARTRLTQDSDSHRNGKLIHHAAWSPIIAIDANGRMTVAYTVGASVDGAGGGCGAGAVDTASIRVITGTHGTWSKPKGIPGTDCQDATAMIVKGGTISLATLRRANSDATDVAFVTNASGAWTHVTVAGGLATGTAISPASLATYDGKPMLAYLKRGRVVYARGSTKTGSFTYQTAAHAQRDELVQPSLAVRGGRPMIAWAQDDGTHYAYQDADGWYADRVMPGRTRAVLAFDQTGHAHLATADYYGGLWIGDRASDGSWTSMKLDTHLTSDIGGIGFGGGTVAMDIAYMRGEGTAHLYSVSSVMGC